MNKIKLIIADDEELFRVGLSFMINREDDFNLLFQAANGNQLIEFLKTSQIIPDIILMDLKMPELNGIETTKFIHQNFPEVKIIILTSFYSKSYVTHLIQEGAASFLVKDTSPDEMLHTIRKVAHQGFHYNRLIMKYIKEIETKNKSNLFSSEFLTNREKQVLLLICKEYRSIEIAKKLHISPRTVDGHRNNLLLKTDSKNIAGLVVYALKNKLVMLDDSIT
jgi:DNA-binding NarL/FixJ family response regulator